MPTARGALRRSLALWGWGQLATGDRRGAVLAVVELAAIGGFAWFGPPLVDGTFTWLLFVGGLIFGAAWAAVALHAYRRAVRRREAFGLSGADGGASELLWLAPAAIVGMTVLWGVGGTLARPDATLARYVRDWRAGDGVDAAALLVAPAAPVAPAAVEAAWGRQLARLGNELLRLDAAGGEDDGIDPDHPFESVRFVAPDGPSGGTGSDRQRFEAEIVRRETAHDTFFGLFPTTSQVIVPVADLGWIDLRRVDRTSGRAGVPDDQAWLIAGMDLLGERLGP